MCMKCLHMVLHLWLLPVTSLLCVCSAKAFSQAMSFTRGDFTKARVASLSKVALIDAAFKMAAAGNGGVPIYGKLTNLGGNGCVTAETTSTKIEVTTTEELAALVRNLQAAEIQPEKYFSKAAVDKMRSEGLDVSCFEHDADVHASQA